MRLARHAQTSLDSFAQTDTRSSFASLPSRFVVVDALRGNDETVAKLKALTADVGEVPVLIEELAERKRALFGSDLRVIDHYTLVEEDGEWRLRVQARGRSAEPPRR